MIFNEVLHKLNYERRLLTLEFEVCGFRLRAFFEGFWLCTHRERDASHAGPGGLVFAVVSFEGRVRLEVRTAAGEHAGCLPPRVLPQFPAEHVLPRLQRLGGQIHMPLVMPTTSSMKIFTMKISTAGMEPFMTHSSDSDPPPPPSTHLCSPARTLQ